jgi:toxin YoeB
MKKIWHETAWEDYLYWIEQDRKILRKVNALVRDIERHPFEGQGKPEPLSGKYSGIWSRRIDEKNRILYFVQNGMLEIVQCRGHYSDT